MNQSPEYANVSLFGTIFLGAVSWLTPETIDLGLKVVTGLGAVVSGVLAARYYWYATKEKKAALKKLQEDDEDE